MITKLIKIGTVLLLLASIFAGCTKEDLTIDPTIPIITVDNYFQTEAEAIKGTNATYTPLSAIYNGAAWHIGDIMSDDTDLGGGGGGDGLETAELDNFTLTSFNPIVNVMWAQCYYGILRANLVLEKVPAIPIMSQAIRNRSLGEARFLRALYYYHLVRLFGDVPLYTNVITAQESSTIARSPKADVLEQIIVDLKEAETLLPTTYSGGDIGRASKGTAKGLLASVYLWQGDKANAATKAKEVIDAGTYRLLVNYGDNFNIDNENSAESMFEVQYRSGGGQWSDYGPAPKQGEWNVYSIPLSLYATPNGALVLTNRNAIFQLLFVGDAPFGNNVYYVDDIYFSSTNNTLPVKLSSFTAVKKDKSVVLNWQTATETNNRGFAVERSRDGQTWSEFNFVKAAASNGAGSKYTTSDATPAKGMNYYRLKQIDLDGKETYSAVKVVNFNANGATVSIYPNPTRGRVNVNVSDVSGKIFYNITQLTGKTVLSGSFSSGTNVNTIDVSRLSAGTYLINIIGDNFSKSEKLMLQ